jgi:ATP phosphoribosyltransferase regulatory subunit
MGFSLYPDPLIDAGFGGQSPKRLFLPLHHDAARAAQLRAEGWQTIAALTGEENGETLRCSHWLDGAEPRPY